MLQVFIAISMQKDMMVLGVMFIFKYIYIYIHTYIVR